MSTERGLLVRVWREYASGLEDDARTRLLLVWCYYMDSIANEQSGRVALRLFERLGFATDDSETWATLPDELTVYRTGPPGAAWTISRREAEYLSEGDPINVGTVSKADVLAYLCREEEVVVRPEHVRMVHTSVHTSAPK